MSRRSALVLVLCVAGAIGIAAATHGHGPALSVTDNTPADLRELTTETWYRFVAAFSARRDCLAPVTVDGAWSFGDRAAYDPDRRLVTVRIPATAANLEAALVHEFAHHLEFSCPYQHGLRLAFLAAQGFAPNASWRHGVSWEKTPSEQFAEAVSVLVLGHRPSHLRVYVSPEALQALRDWAGAE